MARPDLKSLLQSVAAHTQFPPFVWLYRALYALAVWLCARRLGRMGGVRSIYLRRGLASGRAVYGLSDIDLLVMLDEDAPDDTAGRVRRQYALLRRLVPMLPPEEELALYEPEQFRRLYERSPFYRLRFDRGRRAWRRLRGDDIFSLLPPGEDHERELAAQELRPAWDYLSQELLPGDERPGFLRRYVAQKWIAEAARVALLTAGKPAPEGRKEATAEAAALLPEAAGAMTAFGRSFDPDALLGAFVQLARAACRDRPVPATAAVTMRIEGAPREAVELLLPAGALIAMERACAALPGIERAVLVPRLCFDAIGTLDLEPGEFAGATVDAFDLALLGRQLPPAEALREFNRALEPFRARRQRLLLRRRPGALAAARPGMDGQGRGRRAGVLRRPGVGCAIGGHPATGRPGARSNARSSSRTRCKRALGRCSTCSAAGTPSACRCGDFLTLFFEAGRATLLAASTVEVPVTSGQVVEALCRLTPWAEDVLHSIHEEYAREARGLPSEAHRYSRWMAAYAAGLRGLLDRPGGVAEPVDCPARTELTISVVIPTRNRADRLRRALQSLAAQQRSPDQVVVIDNASTDETPSVARSFADALPLDVTREETVGIPQARNTGVARCTGDIVAFLDDDCEAEPGWLAALEAPFLKDPRLGCVGGLLAPFKGRRGLISRFFDERLRGALGGEEARPP